MYRMLPRFNTRCWLNSTRGALLIALLTACIAIVPVHASSDNAAQDLPSAEAMAMAFTRTRAWLNDFTLPAPDEPAARVPLPGARAVCIIIRRPGKVVGIGTDWSGDDLMLRRAAARAFGEALSDPVIRGLAESDPRELGRGLLVDIEIAGAPVPVVAGTYENLAGEIRPGLDGVAIRRGNDWRFRFPTEFRMSSTADSLPFVFPGMLSELGLSAKPLSALQRESGLSVYRFRTTHFVQPGSDQSPIETFRGDLLVPPQAIDRDAIASMARALIEHLEASLWPAEHPLGLHGTYRPLLDQYRPPIAPPGEQAMLAWALSRFAKTPGVEAADRDRALVLAQRIMNDLAVLEEAEDSPLTDQVTCAFLVLAGASLMPQAPVEEAMSMLGAAEGVLVKSFNESSGFRPLDQGAPASGGSQFSPTSQAIIAFALAERLRAGATNPPATTVRAAIDKAWTSVAAPDHLTLMPWIGWAEAAYADATGGELAHREDLMTIRELLRTVQVSPASDPESPDLHGGFRLAGRFGPRTTSQGLRGAAWLATIAGDTRLVPDYLQRAEIERLRAFTRFLAQLAVRPEACWTYPSPARSVGGIRNAAWEADQALPAQALGLLTYGEMLRLLAPAGR